MNSKLQILYYYLKIKLKPGYGKFKSTDELQQWQQQKLNKFKKRVLKKSIYYRSFAAKKLEEFPQLNKKLYMDNFSNINTVNIDKDRALEVAIKSENNRDFSPKLDGFTVGLSSGTSGSRGLFLASDKERNQWAGTILAKVLPKALWRKQKIAFFLRANSNLYETVKSRSIQFKFFDLLESIENHVSELNSYQPDVLVAPANVLVELAKKITQFSNESPLRIKPIKIVAVAEVLTHEDKYFVQKVFQQNIHQIYQATEGFIASTCSEKNLHLNEDLMIIEKDWIDKASGRFSPIITDFTRESQPIVRYRLDDVLILDERPCSCGSIFTRIKAVEGRCDDVLMLPKLSDDTERGVLLGKVFPDFIRNTIISADARAEHYKVEQISETDLIIGIYPLQQSIVDNVERALNKLFVRLEVQKPSYKFVDYTAPKTGDKLRRITRNFSNKQAKVV